jgi:hypothetical protein
MLVLVLSLGLALVTVAGRNGSGELGNSQNLQSRAALVQPTISLSPLDSGSAGFKIGETYPVGIVVDSAGKTIDGVDVVISYDPPNSVQIVGGKVNPTSVFPENPLNLVSNGKIKFSALTFDPKPVTGVVGTFSVKPLVKGEVNFSIEFVPGATTDSNMAEHGTADDVLSEVVNATYKIN